LYFSLPCHPKKEKVKRRKTPKLKNPKIFLKGAKEGLKKRKEKERIKTKKEL
jgi:hypothetical protein